MRGRLPYGISFIAGRCKTRKEDQPRAGQTPRDVSGGHRCLRPASCRATAGRFEFAGTGFHGAPATGPFIPLKYMNEQPIPFIKEDPWRIFRIMAEFVDAFEVFSKVGPCVSIFGSARTPSGQSLLQSRDDAGQRAGQKSPRRRNRRRAGHHGSGQSRREPRPEGKSIGLNIELPFEQKGNRVRQSAACAFIIFFRARFVLSNIALGLFSCRAVLARWTSFLKSSRWCRPSAFPAFPLILFGREYWSGPVQMDEGDTGKGKADQPG